MRFYGGETNFKFIIAKDIPDLLNSVTKNVIFKTYDFKITMEEYFSVLIANDCQAKRK